MAAGGSYFRATRHPWPCLLFLLPMLAGYEAGVIWMGGDQAETLRNGLDAWLRCRLMAGGAWLCWLPPALLLLFFVIWTMRRWHDRPDDLVAILSGMTLESVGFALGLWGLSRALAPALDNFGISLSAADPGADGFRRAVRYLGAGIYEEAIFRLVLFSTMLGVLARVEAKGWLASVAAAVVSAVLFSAAHYWGPYGEPYTNYTFLFRLMAGIYFAFLFRHRGFGVAVGSHACYNVMISVGAA
jgi:membrane protease YdiL (CAAX protease family)